MRSLSFEKAPDPQSRSKPDVSIATLDMQARIRTAQAMFERGIPATPQCGPGHFVGTGTQVLFREVVGARPYLVHPGGRSTTRLRRGGWEPGPCPMFPTGPFSRSCVPVLPRDCAYIARPAGHTPGGVGLKCRVEACSTLVPARSMHGQPLTGQLPVSQILGYQVSGRARRKLTKRRKFPRSGPRRGRTTVGGTSAPSPVSIRLTAQYCARPHRQSRVVCASQVSRDIAPRFRRTRLRAARLSQWATLIRRTAEWAGGLGVWGAGGPWVTRVGGRLGWTADKRRPGLPGLLVCALPAQCR